MRITHVTIVNYIVLLSELVTFLKILHSPQNITTEEQYKRFMSKYMSFVTEVELSEFFSFVRRISTHPEETENSELRVSLTSSRFGCAE